MMPINVACQSCGQKLKAPDSAAGKTARCPKCKENVAIPAVVAECDDDAGYEITEPEPAERAPEAPKRRSTVRARAIPAARSRFEPETPRPARQPHARDDRDFEREPPRRHSPPGNWQRYTYWFFALTLVPIMIDTLVAKNDTEQRYRDTLKKHPEVMKGADEAIAEFAAEGIDLDEDTLLIVARHSIVEDLPEKKIEGALLAKDSLTHWLFALFATILVTLLIVICFENGGATLGQVVGVGVTTATIGICLLIAFQFLADFTQGRILIGRSILVVLFYIIKFIGWSYSLTENPDADFMTAFFGYTCGVGFCEELCKILPLIIFVISASSALEWRGAMLLGLASGAGFGISEGIMYSSSFYNGFEGWETYLVRFVSCVGLHAIWCGAAGVMLSFNQGQLEAGVGESEFWVTILMIIGIPMALHGLYDTFLHKDLPLLALVVAAASFGWLAWMIEASHMTEPKKRSRRRKTA